MLPAILHSLNKKKHKSLPTVTSAGDENEWHGLEKDDTPIITRGENTYHQNPVTWLTTDPWKQIQRVLENIECKIMGKCLYHV